MSDERYYLEEDSDYVLNRESILDRVNCGDLKIDDYIFKAKKSNALALCDKIDIYDLLDDRLADIIEDPDGSLSSFKEKIGNIQLDLNRVMVDIDIYEWSDEKIQVKDILK